MSETTWRFSWRRGAISPALFLLVVGCGGEERAAGSGSLPVAREVAMTAARAVQPGGGAQVVTADAAAEAGLVRVYKSPTCGCCSNWVEHLRQNGFEVATQDMEDVAPVKVAQGVPARLQSCHTATVDGYVIEGHVPADLIQRLLRERPDLAGLAVAGMPVGSPGMEGGRPEPYDVIGFRRDGSTVVYARR